MAFTLSAVEGSGNNLPIGSLITTVDEFGSLFEDSGNYFSDDNVPGRVIPDFDTKVPEVLKGYIADPGRIPFMFPTYSQTANNGAGISNDGTIICITGTSPSIVSIYRQLIGEVGFTKMSFNQTTPFVNNSDNPGYVETDHLGNWLIAFGNSLFISGDNGSTWESRQGPSNITAIHDIRWAADTGTIMMSCIDDDASANERLYRSTNGGRSWSCPTNISQFATVETLGGGVWYALRYGNATIFKSIDDGVTWLSDVVLNITPDPDPYELQMYHSAGNFYLLSGKTIYFGTNLTTLSNIGSNYVSLGVDDVGNALCINTLSKVYHSVNGAIPVSTGTRASNNNSSAGEQSRIKFADGIWVEKGGLHNTDAGMAAFQGWSDWGLVNTSRAHVAETSSTGVSIIAMNTNSYLRSTDNWATWTLHNYNVDMTPINTAFTLASVATDNNGVWAVLPDASSHLFRSLDDGLTWELIDLTVFGTLSTWAQGMCGSDVPGTFFLIEEVDGDGYITTNSFGTLTKKASPYDSLGCANPVYGNDGYFYWISKQQAGTSYYVTSVNIDTGLIKNNALTTNLSAGTNDSLWADDSTLFIKTFMITGISGGTANTPLETSVYGGFKNIIDGKLNFYTTELEVYRLGPDLLFKRSPTQANNFFTLGIKSLGLPANTYIKVS